MTGRPIRMAIIMPTFYEQVIGGSEYQAYLVAEAAKQRGCDVHYVFVSASRCWPNHLEVMLHPIKPHPFSKRFGATWSLYSKTVRRVLAEIRPDAVYVRGGWSFAGAAARYAKRCGCRSIWHVASRADVTPRRILSLMCRPFDIIERRSIEYAIRHSTHVVVQAKYQADLLQEYYGRLSIVIRQPQPEPEESIQKAGPVTVVWIANLKPLKQPEMFLRLARECRDCGNVRFTMVGRPCEGRSTERLEAGLRELHNIDYLREQPMAEVNRILARSHILVNTSLYEGMPNTFVQAWMRRVPVVSMLVDPDDVLATQRIGCISGSFERMVADVRRLIGDPGLREEMGERARTYAMENHALDKNMPRLLDLICARAGNELCEARRVAAEPV